jgi:hypothetical protein
MLMLPGVYRRSLLQAGEEAVIMLRNEIERGIGHQHPGRCPT